MEEILNLIGAFLVLAGSIFLFLGSLGIVRMPDTFNRIQAGTKASTLGTILTFLGIVFLEPTWWGKLFILIIFVIMTNPVSSHVLARASVFINIPMKTKQASNGALAKLKETENKEK